MSSPLACLGAPVVVVAPGRARIAATTVKGAPRSR